jgi:hypothetical protein
MEGEVCMQLITALSLSDLDSLHCVYFRYVEVTSITSSVTGQSVSIPLLKNLAQRMIYQRGRSLSGYLELINHTRASVLRSLYANCISSQAITRFRSH